MQDAAVADADLKKHCLDVYRNQDPEIHLYAGVREMLEQLRAGGIKIGIITDGRPEGQRKKLAALGLYELVDSVLITDELGGPQFRKPCDIAFRIMQRRFGIPFEEMVYVGDNPGKDFQAPGILGMRWLCFENPDGLYFSRGQAAISDTQKIRNICDVLQWVME
jgi:HAD superfamily hydrolase (TIGR01549 family)